MPNNEKPNLIETVDPETLKNEMIFFFMPGKLAMTREYEGDTEDDKVLRTICPYYYWCSSHEFTKPVDPSCKFLFQYQTYFVEGFGAKASEIVQKWAATKGEIRNYLHTFLDLWVDHKRILLDPFELAHSNGLTMDSANFADFANAAGSAVSNFQHEYWKQNVNEEYDVKQKHFWRNQAIYNNQQEFMKILAKEAKKIDTKTVKRGRKPKLEGQSAK